MFDFGERYFLSIALQHELINELTIVLFDALQYEWYT